MSRKHSDHNISSEAIEKLLSFLSFFQKHTMEELVIHQPSEKQEDGALKMGYYTYHPKLSEFFGVLYDHNLHVKDYIGRISWEQVEDEKWIARAGIQELRLAFTFLARSEYWVEGAWKSALEEEVFVKLLERLQKIHE